MKTPAEAARAPEGATYTMTGIRLERICLTISRVDCINPPGVSSWMITHDAPSASASTMAPARKSAVTGVMAASSMRTSNTSFSPENGVGASWVGSRAAARMATGANEAIRRMCCIDCMARTEL